MTNHTCKKNEKSEQVAKYQVAAQFIKQEQRDGYMSSRSTKSTQGVCTLEFQEFCVHSSCCGQNRIQLVGLKQMLISPTTLNQRKDTFEDLFIIPWVEHKQQKFKGSQFVLRERVQFQPLQVIRMLDQNINNIFQHQNETIQYGHTKFLTSKDTHEDYILVISSQLK